MATATATPAGARERILETAYELFNERRIGDVGINEVIARAGVTKATLYNHFSSKEDLVVAYLGLREERATIEWLQAGARAGGTTPEEQLLAIFDLFDEWFHSHDFAGCPFINVLLEFGPEHRIGRATVQHLAVVRRVVEQLAVAAGLRDPGGFARDFHLLMKGSIVSAVEGDMGAGESAKALARLLIDRHR